jgi:hypothetical protein
MNIINGGLLVDWPFFLLLFGVGTVSLCAELFNDAPLMDRPGWTANPIAQIILMLINLAIYWSNTVIVIYGFFILPWYTVLICAVADLMAGAIFYGLFFVPIIQQFGVFVALLISWAISMLAVLWYIGFVTEIHVHPLDLGSYLGIGVCVCFIVRRLFLSCCAGWKELKKSKLLNNAQPPSPLRGPSNLSRRRY